MDRLPLNLIGETLLYYPTTLACLACCNKQIRDRFSAQISVFHRLLEEILPEIPNIRNLGFTELLQEIRNHTSEISMIPLYNNDEKSWRLFRINEKDCIKWIQSPKKYTDGTQFVFLSPLDVFIFGGKARDISKFYRNTYKANTLQDGFQEAQSLLHARFLCGFAKYCSKLYVFGGYPPTSFREAEVYDPQLDKWELLPQVPYDCPNAQSGVFKELIYTAIIDCDDRNGRVIAFDPRSKVYTEKFLLSNSKVRHRVFLAVEDQLLIYESENVVYVSDGNSCYEGRVHTTNIGTPQTETVRCNDCYYVACQDNMVFCINLETDESYVIKPTMMSHLIGLSSPKVSQFWR